MTDDQKNICVKLGNVKYLPGTWDKRMGNSLCNIALNSPDKELTDKQNEWMYRLLYKYRKQLPVTYEKFKHVEFCSQLK